MLKVMLSADLSDAQIAQLVADINFNADIDGDGVAMVDEFVNFISDDECDLTNVVAAYKKRSGDEASLKAIMAAKEAKRDAHEEQHDISAMSFAEREEHFQQLSKLTRAGSFHQRAAAHR